MLCGKALIPKHTFSVWHLYNPVALSLAAVAADRFDNSIWAVVILLVGVGVVSEIQVIKRQWCSSHEAFG